MEPRADVAADRLTQFDQALGDALVTIAHTPQVWRQATTPAAPERPVVGLTLTYASQWRTVFESVRIAAQWVATLTGSPAVAVLAETILDRFLPAQTKRRVAIGDVLVDDIPAEQWLEQLEAKDRAEARTAILEAIERAHVPTAPPPWYAKLFASPWGVVLAIVAFFIVATAWTAWDAFIRQRFERSPPARQVEVRVHLPQHESLPQPTESRVEAAPRRVERCIPIRIQRGATVETTCARAR